MKMKESEWSEWKWMKVNESERKLTKMNESEWKWMKSLRPRWDQRGNVGATLWDQRRWSEITLRWTCEWSLSSASWRTSLLHSFPFPASCRSCCYGRWRADVCGEERSWQRRKKNVNSPSTQRASERQNVWRRLLLCLIVSTQSQRSSNQVRTVGGHMSAPLPRQRDLSPLDKVVRRKLTRPVTDTKVEAGRDADSDHHQRWITCSFGHFWPCLKHPVAESFLEF